MILKGSQRANGADLAIHLMNEFDNEKVEIARIYGAVADDLAGAFAEFEAVAQGTQAKNYLYSLSINPPSPLTREQYDEAIDLIAQRLGLAGQQHIVAFHVKPDKHGISREHCHVVWSKIDAENMKAIHMAHDHAKLMDLACDLAHKFDLQLPPGLKAWEKNEKFEKETLEPNIAEEAQAQDTGISAEDRRIEITECYERSDNAEAFRAALSQKGYVLAAGDRRGFIIVDEFANVHSLTRYVKGHKAKDIKGKLAPLSPEDLPTASQAKDMVRARKQARQEGEDERGKRQAEERTRKSQQALADKHAQRRISLLQKEHEILTRQEAENLSLHAAQKAESSGLVFRVRSAVADLIGRTPGLRSVLGPIQKLTHLDPNERHVLEREALSRRHGREKLDTAREKRTLSRVETREKESLEKTLKKAARQARKLDNKARQEFREAAQDRAAREDTDMGEGDLSENFNDAAEFIEGADRAGEDDDERALSWKERAENLQRGHKPKRGKGYGYRRDSE